MQPDTLLLNSTGLSCQESYPISHPARGFEGYRRASAGHAAVVDQSFNHGDGWQTNSYWIMFGLNPLYEGFGINFTT